MPAQGNVLPSDDMSDISTFTGVSSVLNRDVKQFGKAFLTDGREETCWNSDQGSPQFIVLECPHPVLVEGLELRFQGGFVGLRCTLEVMGGAGETAEGARGSGGWGQVVEFYPEDCNALQRFSVPTHRPITRLRITFHSSTDFYGRITVYRLDVIGRRASQ